MHDTLRKFTIALFLLVAFIPLVNLPPWFAHAPWGQAVLVRMLVPLLGVLFLARLFYEPDFLQRALQRLKAARVILFSFGLFLGVYAIALVFSADPHFSFWGDPDRAWGALNYILYVVLGLIAFLSFSKREWKTVWLGVFAGAGLLALIALAQRFALLPGLIHPTTRVYATLGNPIFLGAYLAPLVLLISGFALWARSRWAWGGAALLLFTIGLTVSRSAFVGVAAGTLFFLFFAPIRSRFFRPAGLVLALAGAAIFLTLFLHPKPPAFLGQETGSAYLWERITPQSILGTDRFAGWGIELQGILDRPLLGYGPYNSAIGFNKHFDPAIPELRDSTGFWDTGHSMYVDIAAGTGLLGFSAFLVFLGTLFWGLTRARKTAGPEEKLQAHGTQAALIAFLAAMIPAFTSTALYLVFFLLLAYSLHLISINQPNQHNQRLPALWNRTHPNIQLALFGLLSVLVLWFLYTAALKPLAVNKEINVAQAKADSGQCQEALAIMERSFPQNSHFEHYHRQRYVDIIGQCITNMPDRVKELSEGAAVMLQEYMRVRPHDPRSWILLGGYLNNLTLLSLDVQERKGLAERAQTALARAEELSPKRAALFEKRAQTYRLIGEYEKSKAQAAKCLQIAPHYGDCWFERVLSVIAEGEEYPIQELREEAKTYWGTGVGETPSFYYQLAEAYGAHPKQNLNNLVVAYEQLVHHVPDNFQFHALLAGLYRDTSQPEKILPHLQEMWRLRPTPETEQQINAFLQLLP